MKVLQINSVCGVGSTGRIATDLYKVMKENGIESKIAFGIGTAENIPQEDTFKFGNKFDYYVHNAVSRITDRAGFYSKINTLKLLKFIKSYEPDIIHIHTIHGYYVNIEILFNFLKEYKKPVIWTLHDCWSFTGHCAHFDLIGCTKWKTQCYNCPIHREYPKSFTDNSRHIYKLKKQLFTGVENLTIVTPSQWLADLVKQSFLKDHTIRIINNGINLDVFKPIENDIKIKYQCENKYLILGVAFGWGKKKGLDIFIELSKRLDENKYKIMLVGTDEHIEKDLPDNIISIHRTKNQNELAKIYSAADLFVNPTREDTYPTVNMESLACGTPVLTFNTGGSPEIIDETCGMVVEKDDIDSMYNEIINICENNVFAKEMCLRKSRMFDKNEKYRNYIELYKKQ
ncbi:MAG: glycosyltransferase [Eubacterium sp.]|nr:glycosyltransferase [Eubacterium sp.]